VVASTCRSADRRMNRRAFVTGLGAVLAAPRGGAAQQAGKVYRVGYLGLVPLPDVLSDAFRQGLREVRYVEGRNIIIEYRTAQSYDQLPASAADLVSLKVDVIIAQGNEMVLAAKKATTTIPIVMPWVLVPVEAGIITSLAHPGGNVTGLSWDAGPEITKK